jgi:hypothetical protein
MADFSIEQALFQRPDLGSPQLLVRSLGFQDAWQPEAERLIQGFGDRSPGVPCPPAVFAQPLGKNHVAVVSVADRDKGLGFFFRIVPRRAYESYLGDPFVMAERLPADWQARNDLPTVTWPEQPLPPRTVQDVRKVLQRVKASALREDEDPEKVEYTAENAESPALLGGVQILVDGGRVVFERPAPDTALLKGLWTLLPTTSRSALWPASFAFGNALQFDALVVPRIAGPQFEGYNSEDNAAEYPAGRYETALQTAAEDGDQAELDSLFTRRSSKETFRMALTLLVLFSIILAVSKLWDTGPLPPRDFPTKAAAAAGMVGAGASGPWTPLGLKLHGDNLFLEKPNPAEKKP